MARGDGCSAHQSCAQLITVVLSSPEFLLRSPEFLLRSPEFLLRSPEFLLRSPEFLLRSSEFFAPLIRVFCSAHQSLLICCADSETALSVVEVFWWYYVHRLLYVHTHQVNFSLSIIMEFMFRQVLNAPGDGGMLQQHIVSAASDDCQHQRVQQHVGWNQRNGTGQKCSTPISETNITKRNNAFPKQADILHLAEGDQGSNELEEDCVLPEHVDSLSPHRTDSVSPHRTDSVSPHNTDSFPPDYTDSVLPNNEEMTNFLRGLGMHKDLPNEPVSFQISSMSEKSSYMDEEGLSLLQGACEALNQWQQEYDTSRGKDHIKEKQRDTSAHWDISARVLKRETTPNTILDIRDRWEDGERVRVLRSLGIIDVESNPCFDNLTRIIQGIFQVSICAITVIDRDVVYIKSRAGQFVGCAPRVGSFCDWVLESSSPQMLVVEDAINDQRFRNCRFVRGPPYVKFYVGCPLVGSSGTTYGTLVIMDVVPRSFGANEYSLLSHFASIVVKELERNASVMLRVCCS